MIKKITVCAATICCFNVFGSENPYFSLIMTEDKRKWWELAQRVSHLKDGSDIKWLTSETEKLIEKGKEHILFDEWHGSVGLFVSAIYQQRADLVSELLKVFENKKLNAVKILAEKGKNPLCYAARVGNLEILQLLLTSYNSMIDSTSDSYNFLMQVADESGTTPLNYGASRGNAALVDYVLQNGGSATILQKGNDGLDPIKGAITSDNVDTLSVLVRYATKNIPGFDIDSLRKFFTEFDEYVFKHECVSDKCTEEHEKVREFLYNPENFK